MVKKMGRQKEEIWHLLYSTWLYFRQTDCALFWISLKAVSGQLETDRQKS
jgi:hypothetical protein